MTHKILVIDDSLAERNHLESILTQAGYQVITGTDGSQAVEKAKTSQVKLILMDVNMPETDGFAATRALKADADTKDIPIIFVTAKDQRADKAWGQMLGAKGYITKPYTEADVINQVKLLLI